MARSLLARLGAVTAAAVATLALGGCPQQPNNGLEEVPFLIDWDPEPTYLGIYYAKSSGIFERAGFDVNIVPLRGANAVIQAVAAGQNPIGTASGGATVIGVANGNATQSLAVIFPRISTVVYGPVGNNISRPQDLYGRRVGIYPTSITKNEFDAFMRANNLDRSRITIVDAVGSDLEFMEQRQADAVLNYAEMSPARLAINPTARRVNGRTSFELPLADYGVNGYGLNIVASPRAMQERPDRMRALSAAAVQGYTEGCANREAAVNAFLQEVHRTPERMEAERPYVTASWDRVCEMIGDTAGQQDAEGWQTTIDTYAGLGLLPRAVTPQEVLGE